MSLTSGVFGSASKKDSIEKRAGEIAANLFEKFKNKKSTNAQPTANNTSMPSSISSSSSSTPTNTNAIPQSSSFSSLLAAAVEANQASNSTSSLLQNLAISFHKNVINNQNQNATQASNLSSTGTLASSPSKKTNSLVVIEDDSYDDNESTFDHENAVKSQPNFKTSQSDFNIKHSPDVLSGETNLKNETTVCNTAKMTTSSSLYSDLANTASIEADTLRKRFQSKKKSLEISFENIKNKHSSINQLNNSITGSSPPQSTLLNSKTEDLNTSDLNTEDNYKINSKSNNDTKEKSSSLKVDSNNNDSISQNSTSNTQQIIEVKTVKPVQLSPINKNDSTNLNQLPNSDNAPNRNYLIHKKKFIIISIFVSILLYYLISTQKSFAIVFSYSFGFTSGILTCLICFYIAYRFNIIKTNISLASAPSNCNAEPLENTQSLLVQTPFLKENKNFDGVYKGWMNELREVYEPDNYFLNKTRSVYVNLDGVMLRLQTTSTRVPKRAVCGENIGTVSFNELRVYDLTNCEVFLLPKELVRKRYWSKKYPLCLKGVKQLNNSFNKSETINTSVKLSNSLTRNLNNVLTSNNSGSFDLDEEEKNKLTRSNSISSETLVLFARTDREKEEWYKLFKRSAAKNLQDSIHYLKLNKTKQQNTRTSITSTTSNMASTSATPLGANTLSEIESSINNNTEKRIVNETSATVQTQTENTNILVNSSLTFINTFLIRLFADFFTHKQWIDLIQNKIQNKLSKIKVPSFMEELRITGIDLGCVVPLIKQTSEPWYDEKGLWVHLEIDYSGGFTMSLATKLNLMKLRTKSSANLQTLNNSSINSSASFSFKNNRENYDEASISMIPSPSKTTPHSNSVPIDISNTNNLSNTDNSDKNINDSNNSSGELVTNSDIDDKLKKRKHLAIIDSNEEDSPESSGDEYVHTGFKNDEENKLVETVNPSKKLLSIVNKIASSNYFQKAAENKYIKMAMENVSNCQLLLNVEVKKLAGTLALNIPPHPSDRLWYGFASNPQLVIVATPQVGEKEVTHSAISDWIAEKLKLEFQKILVFPNMDDFYIPILKSEVHYQNW